MFHRRTDTAAHIWGTNPTNSLSWDKMFQMFQIWLDRVLVKVFQWWSMMGLASYAHYQSASLRGLHTVNPLHPNTALLHWEEGHQGSLWMLVSVSISQFCPAACLLSGTSVHYMKRRTDMVPMWPCYEWCAFAPEVQPRANLSEWTMCRIMP
jgi:hypothetical protein